MLHRWSRPFASETAGARPPSGRGPAEVDLLAPADDRDIPIGAIVSALAAETADPDGRLRAVEDEIRRHWFSLQSLVREHAALIRAAQGGNAGKTLSPALERLAEVRSEGLPVPSPRTRLMVPPPRARLRAV